MVKKPKPYNRFNNQKKKLGSLILNIIVIACVSLSMCILLFISFNCLINLLIFFFSNQFMTPVLFFLLLLLLLLLLLFLSCIHSFCYFFFFVGKNSCPFFSSNWFVGRIYGRFFFIWRGFFGSFFLFQYLLCLPLLYMFSSFLSFISPFIKHTYLSHFVPIREGVYFWFQHTNIRIFWCLKC